MMDERVADDLAQAFDDGYERGHADGVRETEDKYKELIERDVAKKPRIRIEYEEPDWEEEIPYCPSCDCDVLWCDFCQNCGQRIDRSE